MLEDQKIVKTVNPLEDQYGSVDDVGLYEHRQNGVYFFGERILDRLEDIEFTKKHPPPPALGSLEDRLQVKRDKLVNTIETCRQSVRALINTPKSQIINKSYEAELENMPLEFGEGASVVEALSDASDDTFISFVRWNKEFIDGLNEINREELEQEFEQAKSKTLDFLDRSGIPVDMDAVVGKLDRLTVAFVDPFETTQENLAGYFSGEAEFIGVAPQYSAEDRTHIMTHELLHAISGRLVTHTKTLYGGEFGGIDVDVKRGGFHAGEHFVWLNEAVTEQLAQLIIQDRKIDFQHLELTRDFISMNDTTVGAYDDARKFLVMVGMYLEIQDKDIVKPLIAAYFEDYDPEGVPGERSPQWKKVMQVIGDYLSPQTLRYADQIFAQRKSLAEHIYLPGVTMRLGLSDDILEYPAAAAHSKDVKWIQEKRKQAGSVALRNLSE